MSAAVVVLAAGAGTRVGAPVNKVLLPLRGRPVIGWSVATALAVPDVVRVMVVVRAGEEGALGAALAPVLAEREVRIVVGGQSRHDSEVAAFAALKHDVASGAVDVIAIHDGARPLASVSLYQAVIAQARRLGGAIPAVPLSGLLGPDGVVAPSVGVQTPQAFRAGPLLAAYAAAGRAGFRGTDTAASLEWHRAMAPSEVRLVAVPSTSGNLKITFAEDLLLAERLHQVDVGGVVHPSSG